MSVSPASSGPAVRHPADPTGGRGCPLASGRAAAPARRSQHRPGTVSAQRQAAGAALATVSVVTVRPNLGRNDLRGGEEHVQISSRFGGGGAPRRPRPPRPAVWGGGACGPPGGAGGGPRRGAWRGPGGAVSEGVAPGRGWGRGRGGRPGGGGGSGGGWGRPRSAGRGPDGPSGGGRGLAASVQVGGGGVFASSALAASVVLGGAGVANAQ